MVYDIARGQIPVNPVSNYYQGRAVRAGIRSQELQNENFERSQARQDELVEIERAREERLQAQLTQQITDFENKVGRQRAEDYTRDLFGRISSIDSAVKNGELSEASALERAQESFFEYAESLPEDMAKPIMDKLSDGLTMDEYRQIRASNFAGLKQFGLIDEDDRRGEFERIVDGLDISEEAKQELYAARAEKAVTITGRTPEDVASDPRTPSQAGSDFQANMQTYNDATDVQEIVSSALPRILENPAAVGVSGSLAGGGAGFLSAMGQEQLAEQWAQRVSGASPEEIAGIQAELQELRGQLIPIVTGQESRARLSDEERKVGDRAVSLLDRGIENVADLAVSYPKAIGAIRQFYIASYARQYRIAARDPNIDFPYDLSSRNARVDLVEEALNAGIDEANINRMIVRLRRIQGVSDD